jgi:tetratricopeptide (TPR) repeat protein
MLGPFSIGAILAGRYEITALLGEGGMGAVYRAHDRELAEDIALKVLKPELATAPNALGRFRREVKLARRVTHVNVARTYDLGFHDGAYFLTMELITGESLAAFARTAIPLGEALRIAHEVCLGLGEAHAVGVVHRDLKPENVMLAETRVVVTDFGIARALEGADAHATAGNVTGTPAYMAPEQVEGKAIDGRSDVYALGVMLFQLLTGGLPFQGDTAFSLAAARLVSNAPDVRTLVPDLPEGVAELIARMLARRREDRPDATSVGRDIDRLRGARSGTESRPLAFTSDLPLVSTTRTAVLRPFDSDFASGALGLDLERALADALTACKGALITSARTSPGAKGELVIEGQVRGSGGKVRVRARLVDTTRGTTIWAESVTGAADDPFGLEDALTAAVVAAVTQATARVHGPSDPALRARFDEMRKFLGRFNQNDTRRAVATAEALLAEAPHDPWILGALGLGIVQIWLAGGSTDSALIARAEELALRAIDLEPRAADAYVVIGSIRLGVCDYRAALRAVQEALRHNPRLAQAHHVIAMIMGEVGSLDEAVRRLELCLRLDPSSLTARNTHVWALALLGKKAAAEQAIAEAHAIAGAGSFIPMEIRLCVWWHEPERAASLLERVSALKTGGVLGFATPFLRAYASGKRIEGYDEALTQQAFREASPRRRCGMSQVFAEYYADRGEEEQVFVWLDEAMKLPFIDMAWLDLCPSLAAIRPSPRFAEIRAKTALRITQLLNGS